MGADDRPERGAGEGFDHQAGVGLAPEARAAFLVDFSENRVANEVVDEPAAGRGDDPVEQAHVCGPVVADELVDAPAKGIRLGERVAVTVDEDTVEFLRLLHYLAPDGQGFYDKGTEEVVELKGKLGGKG